MREKNRMPQSLTSASSAKSASLFAERNEYWFWMRRLEKLIAIIQGNESSHNNFTSITTLGLARYERYPMHYITPHIK